MKALKGLFGFLFSFFRLFFRLIKNPLALMAVIAVFFGVFWMCGIPPRDVPDWIQSVARPRFYGRMKELRHESLLTAGKLLETSSPTAAGVIKALDSKLSGGDASPDGPVDAVVSIGGEKPADPSGFDQIPPEMSDEYRSYEQIAREAERRAREREAAMVEYRRNETAWNDVIKQIPSTAEVEEDPFDGVPPEKIVEGKAVVKGGSVINVGWRNIELNVRIRGGSAGRAFQTLQREAGGKTVRCAPEGAKYRCLAGKTDLGRLLADNSLADEL